MFFEVGGVAEMMVTLPILINDWLKEANIEGVRGRLSLNSKSCHISINNVFIGYVLMDSIYIQSDEDMHLLKPEDPEFFIKLSTIIHNYKLRNTW